VNKSFLVVTAFAEVAAGLALLLAPGFVFQALLGTSLPSAEALIVGRIGGAALLALGIVCWLARGDSGSPSLRGVLCGMLTYNVGVAALLGHAGFLLHVSGALLWPAVATHTGLALWNLLCLRAAARGRTA
jgi:hypothetical protein